MSRSRNRQEAWNKVFLSLPIIERVNNNGYYDITADEMKHFGEFEPRNMAKIDFREHLPLVMADNHLACLAIKNGVYRIGRFDPFINIPERSTSFVNHVSFPPNYRTLNPQNLENECRLLDAAKISGVLANAFGEPVELTIRGRTYSSEFKFSLNNINFPISSVQIEIDGGYEGYNTINLVEAKIGLRGSLNVRQLLYPYHEWDGRCGQFKSVRTFAVFYDAPLIRIIPLFINNGGVSVIALEERTYQIENSPNFDIMRIAEDINAQPPIHNIPFPQADRFTTILTLFMQLVNADEFKVTKDELFDNIDLVKRQVDYYSNALLWLGVATQDRYYLYATDFGIDLSRMSHADRIFNLACVVFSDPVFHYVLHNNIRRPNDEVGFLFRKYWGINSLSTLSRRFSTVLSWIRYFKEQTNFPII